MCSRFGPENVCPPKQYLKGKDGAPITDPKDIANEHAAAFTDNSSSAHYSARFQTIKAQDERARIDSTSDNTEVYNKPFRLRDLRRSILKAKPRAPGPDGIHNNLLKHLPEDTLKILKEILNITYPGYSRPAHFLSWLAGSGDIVHWPDYTPNHQRSQLGTLPRRIVGISMTNITRRDPCIPRHWAMGHIIKRQNKNITLQCT